MRFSRSANGDFGARGSSGSQSANARIALRRVSWFVSLNRRMYEAAAASSSPGQDCEQPGFIHVVAALLKRKLRPHEPFRINGVKRLPASVGKHPVDDIDA